MTRAAHHESCAAPGRRLRSTSREVYMGLDPSDSPGPCVPRAPWSRQSIRGRHFRLPALEGATIDQPVEEEAADVRRDGVAAVQLRRNGTRVRRETHPTVPQSTAGTTRAGSTPDANAACDAKRSRARPPAVDAVFDGRGEKSAPLCSALVWVLRRARPRLRPRACVSRRGTHAPPMSALDATSASRPTSTPIDGAGHLMDPVASLGRLLSPPSAASRAFHFVGGAPSQRRENRVAPKRMSACPASATPARVSAAGPA
jgi:hypothetical protein